MSSTNSTTQPFTLRWGILATGNIAKTFTKDLLVDPITRNVTDIRHTVVAAAASSSKSRAQDFLNTVGAPSTATAHGSYLSLVQDPNVDIIYVATPHSHHYQHTRLCLEHGKHVLVEKPFTVNFAQTKILFEIAKEKKLFIMEAVWTRFFPVAKEIQAFIQKGKLGAVKRVYADLSFWKDVEGEFGTEDRMVNLELAGGALLDLGVYSLTWIYLTLYHTLPPSLRQDPKVFSTMAKYPQTGADEMTSIILDFPQPSAPLSATNGASASAPLTSSAHAIALTALRVPSTTNPSHPTSSPDPIRIQGTLGDISIAWPPYRPTAYTLVPAANDSRGQIAEWGFERREREVPGGGSGMFYEADECARCVREGRLESETMGWEETGSVMRVMDEVRRAAGLAYGEGIEGVGWDGEA
ncbi:dimeric dihydrodiol dehydrogenase [Dendryphion nanum]|uniref:D-xylose 1-dehydrogenase (NADP(+), D-xylono-1,5-lactone-forming) n=1 Tax=Dendryphion nanum TaxID=256645 RepID=A0A9P9DEH7_9PLEO|nr:dimeric dihydrodiol dehydrogenase [Dendryphion nanum]